MAVLDKRITQATIDERDLKKMNEFRASIGLPLIKTLKRLCMRCSKEFLSYGYQHRMCDYCRLVDPEE